MKRNIKSLILYQAALIPTKNLKLPLSVFKTELYQST